MQVQKIDGHWFMAVSYWDAGQVLVNVDDPANPVYGTDSDFSSPDPETGFQIAEGTRTSPTGAQRQVPALDRRGLLVVPGPLPDQQRTQPGRVQHRLVQLDAAAPRDRDGRYDGVRRQRLRGGRERKRRQRPRRGPVSGINGRGHRRLHPRRVLLLQEDRVRPDCRLRRGHRRAEPRWHRNGLLPDAFICGSKGHDYTPTIPAICIGHRASHLLFDDAPSYTVPDLATGGDMPAIGTVDESMSAVNTYDSWGYIHQHDGMTLQEQDTYAVPEALDEDFATGFGNLTVHEVKTDPRAGKYLAYASWYDAGLRVLKFGPGGIREMGPFIVVPCHVRGALCRAGGHSPPALPETPHPTCTDPVDDMLLDRRVPGRQPAAEAGQCTPLDSTHPAVRTTSATRRPLRDSWPRVPPP